MTRYYPRHAVFELNCSSQLYRSAHYRSLKGNNPTGVCTHGCIELYHKHWALYINVFLLKVSFQNSGSYSIVPVPIVSHEVPVQA
jgi:hypothetical protein